MKVQRGVRNYSQEDYVNLFKSRKYTDIYQEYEHRINCDLEVFYAQFLGTSFYHSYSLIKTVLVDYFVSKKDLYDYENIRYLYEDLCGWRHHEFRDLLINSHIDLKEFNFNSLKYSDFCYELFSLNNKNDIYFLELPNGKIVELEEVDFFALCIFTYHYTHQTSDEDGYYYLSEEEALTHWLSEEKLQSLMPVTFCYDQVLNTEYWFSIINELFIYFQNALMRSGHKIALSREKSRLAKIKAEKYQKETAQKFKDIEELWASGKWKKATTCANDIYNIDGIDLPYHTVYRYILKYKKSKK